MITQTDKDAIAGVVASFEGAFVTGSYLVDKDKANDIDVVVPLLAWKLFLGRSQVAVLTERSKNAIISNIRFDIQEPDDDEDHYADEENDMFELHSHWRGGGINLLIIRDRFVPAYQAASIRLSNNPKAYKTREERVEIHQRLKKIIRDMFEDAEIDGDEIPW